MCSAIATTIYQTTAGGLPMLKLKTGICVDCPPGSPEKFLTAGRCQTHYWIYRRQVSAKRVAERTPLLRSNKDELYKWFNHHNTYNKWVCENCGINLYPLSVHSASCCQAHILPKNHFKSVQSVLDNHLTLGDSLYHPCNCHDEFDSSWEKAQTMKVWPVALERFQKFMHLIAKSEYKRLPDPFYKLIYAH